MDAWPLQPDEQAGWAPLVALGSAGSELSAPRVNMRPPVAETPDAELLRRVAGGDVTAFEQFYDRYSTALHALAMKILRDAHEAEEVLQEAMTLIWERAASYNAAAGKPLSWAMAITRNKAIDLIRSTQRASRLIEEAALDAEARASSVPAESRAFLEEASTLVRRALAELPAEQRRSIELAYFGGLTQSEIASQLGEPLGTVKARIRRGMMTLRDALENRL
jgi:RNA polymerase sigma-70 factor (ECF subfamily)